MSHHEEAHKHHILPLWMYISVATTLLVMTGLTIAVAHFDFNTMTGFAEMNFVIAMLIATIKASLVALIFMHLLFDNKFYLFALVSAVGCLLIFITLTMADTSFRGAVNAVEKRPIVEQVTSDKFVEKKEHGSEHGATEHGTEKPAEASHK